MTRHLRAAWRAWRLIVLVAVNVPSLLARRSPARRSAWLHAMSCRVLRLLGARVVVHGQVPADGLIVANHLGYLDVLVLAATLPAVFVAKSDVRRWPVVGWLCARTGTIFVERGRRAAVRPCLDQIRSVLRAGNAAVLFPEGTSSGGADVLPFKTSLLAAAETCSTVPAAIAYRMPGGGDAAEELCYWRDMTFMPHLWNVLGNPGFVAQLRFGTRRPPGSHRKQLAASLRQDVAALRQPVRRELLVRIRATTLPCAD